MTKWSQYWRMHLHESFSFALFSRNMALILQNKRSWRSSLIMAMSNWIILTYLLRRIFCQFNKIRNKIKIKLVLRLIQFNLEIYHQLRYHKPSILTTTTTTAITTTTTNTIASYMRNCTGSALVWVMACRLFGTKPLPEPMLIYSQLDL